MSIVTMSWFLTVLGNFNAMVSIFHGDGTVAVAHGGIEMDQGINTKVRKQIFLLEQLKLPFIALSNFGVLFPLRYS